MKAVGGKVREPSAWRGKETGKRKQKAGFLLGVGGRKRQEDLSAKKHHRKKKRPKKTNTLGGGWNSEGRRQKGFWEEM